MEKLNYYDDDIVRTHAIFFTREKISIISIVSILMILFFGNNLNKCRNLDSGSWTNIDTFWFVCCVLFVVIFMITLVVSFAFIFCTIPADWGGSPMYSKHDLTVLKKKYEIERIMIRLDDKLGRIMANTDATPRINDVADIIGYCTLLLVSMGATVEDIRKLKD